jgi:hypothetical protein
MKVGELVYCKLCHQRVRVAGHDDAPVFYLDWHAFAMPLTDDGEWKLTCPASGTFIERVTT